jgi:hypothetical protein
MKTKASASGRQNQPHAEREDAEGNGHEDHEGVTKITKKNFSFWYLLHFILFIRVPGFAFARTALGRYPLLAVVPANAGNLQVLIFQHIECINNYSSIILRSRQIAGECLPCLASDHESEAAILLNQDQNQVHCSHLV